MDTGNDGRRVCRVMGNVIEYICYPCGRDRVKAGRRLIQEQNVGAPDKLQPNAHSPHLSSTNAPAFAPIRITYSGILDVRNPQLLKEYYNALRFV